MESKNSGLIDSRDGRGKAKHNQRIEEEQIYFIHDEWKIPCANDCS